MNDRDRLWTARLRAAAAHWRECYASARESIGLALGQLEQISADRDMQAERAEAAEAELADMRPKYEALRVEIDAHDQESAMAERNTTLLTTRAALAAPDSAEHSYGQPPQPRVYESDFDDQPQTERCRCKNCQGPGKCRCCDEPRFEMPDDLY